MLLEDSSLGLGGWGDVGCGGWGLETGVLARAATGIRIINDAPAQGSRATPTSGPFSLLGLHR